MWPLYILLIVLIIGYSLQNNPIIGAAAFVVVVIIIVLIAKEAKEEISEKGKKEGIKDIAMAIGAAVGFWIILVIVLQTTSPINAVASCSMLPVLQKGDMVVLHGISNLSQFAATNHVPVVKISAQDLASMQSGAQNEFLAYYAFLNGNRSKITNILPAGSNYTYSVALYDTQCIARLQFQGQQQELNKCYIGENPQNNIIKYNYTMGRVQISTQYGPQTYRIIDTSQVSIANTTINENYSNPIIVYQTNSNDTFSGAIIHRLVAVLNVNGAYYTLTKGDNNPGLDMQFGNYPARQGDVIGSVLYDVPLVGYFKLIISGQIGTTPGCNQVIVSH